MINEKISRLWPSLLIPALFIMATVLQFWPALSGAATLSKVHQLAEWDSLFAAQRSGQSMLMDPSLVYLMVPGYLLKATMIHSGQWPLWNQYSGLGCPLAADPQALAFSPLHLPLIFSPGLVAYNQVMVLEIIILGLSTFALARSLKLGPLPSALAMIALAFCPYERWYLELLGNGFCFVPLVFWLILGLRSNVTAARIWLCGLGCALMLLSAHPELSFFSIGLASLTLMLYALCDRPKGAGAKPLLNTFLALLGAGFVAFMLSAPMLIPFLEYLRNSDSYKFGSGAPAIVPWQTLVYNLLQPGYAGGSPTLGPAVLPLLPLALCTARGHRLMVLVLASVAIFCTAITGKVFPFNVILSHPPLSYLVVNYAFPSLLLLIAILAAYGFEASLAAARRLKEQSKTGTGDHTEAANIKTVAVIASIALALSVVLFAGLATPLHLPLKSANFDLCLPNYTFNRNDVVRYSIFAVLAAVAIAAAKFKPGKLSTALLIGTVCLAQSAEIIVSAKSLPDRPHFQYKDDNIVPELKSLTREGTYRFIASGSHLFRPNSNVVFALSDLRTHNPLFPKRYLDFMKACGADLDQFNQVFDGPLSPLLNLASVNAVVSQYPVISKNDLHSLAQKHLPDLSVTAAPGLTASFCSAALDGTRQSIFGRLSISATPEQAERLKYNLALYDDSGHTVWFSDPLPLAPDLKTPRFFAIPGAGIAASQRLVLGLQFFDTISGQWLGKPASAGDSGKYKDLFVLGEVNLAEHKGPDNVEYRRLFESPTRVSIYQNDGALPRAFAVHRSHNVTGAEQSLAFIQSPSFNPLQTAVIETKAPSPAAELNSFAEANSGQDHVTVNSLRADKIIVDADLGAPGLVILTDMFYPGWEAQIDDKPTEILRADFLMRAVAVPSGKHRIVFSYFPASLKIGLFLFCAGLILGLLLSLATAGKRRASEVSL